MGCCASKQVEHEQDERTRLIESNVAAHHYGPNGMMVAQPDSEQNQVRELESLQRIVERTAGNLIDIPSTFQLERLQQNEATERTQEYLSALSTVKLSNQTIRKLCSMTSVKTGPEVPNMTENGLHHNHLLSSQDFTGGQTNGTNGRSSTSSSNSVKAPSVRDVLAEKSVDAATLGWMTGAMTELQQATETIEVEDVGEIIVNLGPPLNY